MSAVTGPAVRGMDLGPMRDQLQARIDVIKAEVEALEAERIELERVLGAMPRPAAATPRRRQRAATSGGGRARRRRSAPPAGTAARRVTVGRPTAEQTERLVALLREGPRAREDIARALGLSPTRTGQLLDALGDRVTSETDPDNRRRKRWRLAEQPAAPGAGTHMRAGPGRSGSGPAHAGAAGAARG
jgi:hypothetical protein